MDLAVINYLRTLPPDTVLYSVLLAVVLSPFVYRWRSRVRRILVRLSWIGLLLAWAVSYENFRATAAASQLDNFPRHQSCA